MVSLPLVCWYPQSPCHDPVQGQLPLRPTQLPSPRDAEACSRDVTTMHARRATSAQCPRPVEIQRARRLRLRTVSFVPQEHAREGCDQAQTSTTPSEGLTGLAGAAARKYTRLERSARGLAAMDVRGCCCGSDDSCAAAEDTNCTLSSCCVFLKRGHSRLPDPGTRKRTKEFLHTRSAMLPRLLPRLVRLQSCLAAHNVHGWRCWKSNCTARVRLGTPMRSARCAWC
jgi:hypothetical protein